MATDQDSAADDGEDLPENCCVLCGDEMTGDLDLDTGMCSACAGADADGTENYGE